MTAPSSLLRRASLPVFLTGGLLAVSTASAQMVFSSVSTFAATASPATINSNSGYADVAAFKTFAEAQQLAGNGAIIDFETVANQTNTNSITANYAGGAFVMSNDDLYFGNNYNTNNNNPSYTSNSHYLGFEAIQSVNNVVGSRNTFTLPAGRELTTFGLVGLARSSARTPYIELGLSDSSTVVLGGSLSATGTAHALLAYTTSPGISITSIAFGNGGAFNAGTNPQGMGGFMRWDDMVIVTSAAVPEPSTYAALAGLGILGFAIVRRRASRR